MTTGNPALNDRYFESETMTAPRTGAMTVQGAIMKTAVLTTIMVAVAAVTWNIVFPDGITSSSKASLYINKTAMIGAIAGGAIGGLILSLIMCFRPKSSPILAPLYAVCEGALLGAISGVYAHGAYPGIVLQAGLLTIGVLAMMLGLYASRIIVMSDKLRIGIIAATGSIFLVYLATMLLGFFGVQIPYIHGSGPIGIGFSVVVVIIAAFNLVLDFDTIERGARYGAPKYMEWYSAFGLLVTLVWLYLEILRLLAKLNSSRE